jgi:hypothetical protein
MYRSFHAALAKPHGDATLRAGFVAACIFIAGAVNTASAAQALTQLDVPVVLRGDVLLKTASDVTDAIARAYGPLSWSANSSGAAAQLRPDLTIDGKLRIEGDTLSDAHLAPFLQLVSEVRGPLVITDTTQVRTLDSLSRLSKAPYIHLRRNAALFSACGLAGLDPSNPPQMITVFGSDSTVELPTLPTAVGTRIGVSTGCNGRSSTSPGESRKPEALPSSAAVDVVAPVVRRRRAQHEAESCFVDVVTDSTSAGGAEGENVIYINFYGSGRKIPKPSSVAVADTVEADTAVAPASKVDLAAAALKGCKQQSAGDDCTELTQTLKEAQAQEAADASKALKDYESACKTDTANCDPAREKALKGAVDVAQEKAQEAAEAETLPPSDGASVDGSLPPSDGASVDGSGGTASEGADEDDGEAAVEQAAKKKAVEDATEALDACEADKTKCDSDKEKELQKVLKSAQENLDNDKLAGKTDTEKAAEDKAAKEANEKELADASKALKDYEAACKTDTTKCDSDKENELKGAVDVAQEKVDKDAPSSGTCVLSSGIVTAAVAAAAMWAL